MWIYFQVILLRQGDPKIENQSILIQHDLNCCSKTEYQDSVGSFEINRSGFHQMKWNNMEIS